jgi:hypothetical protein
MTTLRLGWCDFVDEKLLCRVVFDDTEYEEVLEATEPTSDIVIQHDNGNEELEPETVEVRLMWDIGDAIATYIGNCRLDAAIDSLSSGHT